MANRPDSLQKSALVCLGVVGAGAMGRGIALLGLRAGHDVVLVDPSTDALLAAAAYLQKYLTKSDQAEQFSQAKFSELTQDLARVDIIIEAAPEILELKQSLFKEFESICSDDTLLLTNTSTLSVTVIAAAVEAPERVAGMHFFNPPALLPLVEVIAGAKSSEATLLAVEGLATAFGKTALRAADRSGFIVNRVARPFYGEALRLLGEGVATVPVIDSLVEGAGFKLGPFRLMDLIGIDINAAAMESVYRQTFEEPRYKPHWIQLQKVQAGDLGRKTGRGFYIYPEKKVQTEQPQVQLGAGGGVVLVRGESSFSEIIAASGLRGLDRASADDFVSAGFVLSVPGQRAWSLSVAGLLDELPPEAPVFVASEAASMTEIAAQVSGPERIVGLDKFLGSSRLITVVETPFLNREMRSRAVAVLNALGLRPIWIPPAPGLVLPRILSMLINEAVFAVSEGLADADTIDRAMKLGVNYPHGLLEWDRRIGFGRTLIVLEHLWTEYREERYRPCRLLRQWAHEERI